MTIKQVITEGDKPVKVWTEELDERSRMSLGAEQLDERALKKVFDQISRDVPVGRAQHRDERALSDAAEPFAAPLAALTE
jgi:hypothetical protein